MYAGNVSTTSSQFPLIFKCIYDTKDFTVYK